MLNNTSVLLEIGYVLKKNRKSPKKTNKKNKSIQKVILLLDTKDSPDVLFYTS